MITPTRVEKSEESCEKTQSRLSILYKRYQENEQHGRPPSITLQVSPFSIPLLRQRPRLHFEKKSGAFSMQVISCPTQEVFVDPFSLELESLFSEETTVSAKFSSKDTATVEPINISVKPIEWLMLVEDTRALLADISEQLSSIDIGSPRGQVNDQESGAEDFGSVKASVAKNEGISDGGDRDISRYLLEECIRKGYLKETERP